MATSTQTGGRDATTAVVPGRYALSIGDPELPLPEGWDWTKLTDVARLESGHTPSRKETDYWDGGMPWIGIKDATQNHGRLIPDTLQHVSELGIANSSARVLPEHTVCLSRTASVGYVVVMGQPMATSQDFVNWVCSDRIDWRFLKYVLVAEREALLRYAHGTTHQTIYFPEAKAFHVALPPIEEQRAIASVLGALEDKIESNRRLADRMERVAETLFGHLLVANRENDWTHSTLKDLARYINGRNFTKGASGHGRMVVRIADLNSGPGNSTVYADVEAAKDNIARPGDILFAWSGSLDVYRWPRDEALVNQHIFKVIPQGLPPWFVFFHLKRAMPVFRGIAADKATTMGHIRRQDLETVDVAIPSTDALDEANRSIEPLYGASLSLLAEIQHLVTIRDALVPRVVSGRVRVEEWANGSARPGVS